MRVESFEHLDEDITLGLELAQGIFHHLTFLSELGGAHGGDGRDVILRLRGLFIGFTERLGGGGIVLLGNFESFFQRAQALVRGAQRLLREWIFPFRTL